MRKTVRSCSNMPLPSASKWRADPGPSRQRSPSTSSSIAPELSLFTPPPARRRARIVIDYVLAPPFPKGSTKADYQPMHLSLATQSPVSVAPAAVEHPPVARSPVEHTPPPSPQGQKGKERERDVVPTDEDILLRALTDQADASPDALMDAFYTPTEIPLKDEDAYPPLTALDLSANSRFQFAYAWRMYASKLREAELDCAFKFGLPKTVGVWARSVDTLSSRLSGTAGHVSIRQLRQWKLAPPHSPQDKSVRYVLDDLEEHSTVEADGSLSLPADVPSVSTPATDPTLSTLNSLSSTAVDVGSDMNQFFNGLGDSPGKSDLPRSAHTHSSEAQMNTLGLTLPPFELGPGAESTDNNGFFLGVPPSPTPQDIDSSRVPEPTPCSPFQSANYFPPSPSNLFAGEPLVDNWSLGQGEGPQPKHDSTPVNDILPTVLDTIDPSLLGSRQLQALPLAAKAGDPTQKRRPKLPEPVVYVRRPIDSSSLPLLPGKRSVQIKYRDTFGSPAPSSAQLESNEAFPDHAENSIELFTNNTNNSPRAKRCSAPSLKLRESHPTCDSDSDYTPETSKGKLKSRPSRAGVENKASAVERESTKAGTPPAMSFCHQCRNKTARPKMMCSNAIESRVCGKRFCNRCILNRYPDITFDEESAGFLCPVCTNTCNCSVCSRNRGEEFISMRLGGLAASIFKTKVTLVRDSSKSLHPTSPRHASKRQNASETTTPTPEPGAVAIPSQFWAHVYGIEGERVGSAFMTREQMERMETRGPSLPPPPPPPSISHPPKKARKPGPLGKKREKVRRPRVFVGRPLAFWKVHKIRDLEPSTDVEAMWRENNTTSDPGLSSRRCRYYIGNRQSLYEPYKRMPRTGRSTPASSRASSPELSARSLTPLSEVEPGYWPQPAVGECCSWAPPGTSVWESLPDFEALTAALGQGSGPGSSRDTDIGLGADGSELMPTSATSLSEEEVARAISVALASLSVDSVT